MLRVHFTDADLALVRVARGPDPLWETVLALYRLAEPDGPAPVFGRWRLRALSEIADRRLAPKARLLTTLVPPEPAHFPDFLTPPEAAQGLSAGLAALRSTPRRRLRAELDRLDGFRRPPRSAAGWLSDLANGDRRRLDEVAEALRGLYEAVIRPDWTGAAAGVAADRAGRTRALLDGGVHGLLRSLRPAARWEPPVLHVRCPVDRDLYLRGRGLHLVPSWFCWRTAVAPADPDLPPVLVHPVDHAVEGASTAGGGRAAALSALLGPTRARALARLRDPATTGELAGRLGLSAGAASKHAKALREAGLVVSRRDGAGVLHTLTPLGAALLSGELPPAPR